MAVFGTYNRYWDALGTGVNLAFIKEVDIKTTAFEPQYGKAAGGIVEIVTKSGSNAYHGAIAAFMSPGAWYATRNQTCNLGIHNDCPRPATTLRPSTIFQVNLVGSFLVSRTRFSSSAHLTRLYPRTSGMPDQESR
ncbi:MAG: hypothetical protein WDM87_16555 [Terracidiphilus sp.]